ncbi:MAG: hypothetical protein HS127_13230 [Planctomycetia bacterium]|uniref:lipopolysaccharide kinase InaA family protein n=1 Tax=Candidatus Kuenenia sp. TaxID=2499824 RepID=UPI001D76C289|nr:hypothetical protein [Planctomycetia bacterium]
MFKEYISYTESNNQWLVHEQFTFLVSHLKHLKTLNNHTTIKINREDRFKILAGFEVVKSDEAYSFILKIYKYPSLFQQLKQLFKRTKAFREFYMTYLAASKGVPVEVPVAFGEQKCFFIKKSYLIIKKIENSHTLNDYFRDNNCFAERRSVLKEFGKLSRFIHDSGIKQDDYSLNNFLVFKRDGDTRIILIDFERVSIQRGSLLEKQSILYLAKLNRAKGIFCNTERLRFLMTYVEGDYVYCKQLAKRIESLTFALQKKDSKKFVQQCIHENRKFGIFKNAGFFGRYRKAYSQETIRILLATTDQMVNGTVQAKQYQIVRFTKMPSYQKRFRGAVDLWKHANALFALRINVPVPVGIFKRISSGWPRDEFFIYQLPDNWTPIDQHLSSTDDLAILMRTIKVFIEEISPFGIVRQDMNTRDIILHTDKHHRLKCFLKDYSAFFLNRQSYQQNKSFNMKVFDQALMIHGQLKKSEG